MKKGITKSLTTTTRVEMDELDLATLIIEHSGIPKTGAKVDFDVSRDCLMGCTVTSVQTEDVGEG